jgi:ComF family protein
MRFIRHILDFILPTSCSFCNDPVADSEFPFFCTTCWSDFTLVQGPACPHCGKPFDSPEALSSSPDHVCLSCRRLPPLFDQALSVGYFEGPLREAVHQFKYRPCRSLGRPLGEWMATNVRPVSNIDIIIPVPLHAKRLRQRGFNQALLLAHGMAKMHHIPCSCDNLYRLRATRPQVELTGAERILNVAGAFALCKPGDVEDRSVVLVDDVFTTGATMNECALVLKQAGAARVTACTLARALS